MGPEQVLVEQAVYGEVPGRGHGLRTASTSSPIVFSIASKLDLPDAVPLGVQTWWPFVRGFPVDDYYVLARTFLDSSASRGGMVLTHALIVKLDDICEVGNLGTLFGLLAPSVTSCPCSVATLHLDINASSHPPAADLIGAANALTAQGLAPVARLGIEGFEHLVDSLWRNLWPALRRTFAFRLSFDPKDVIEQPTPIIVCTPEQLQSRWTKHSIVKPDDQTPGSEPARFLCGQRDLQPITDLAQSLGLEIHTLRELNRFERLSSLISGGECFNDLLAAIRLADGLSNQPTLGVILKNKLISRFMDLIPSADCNQLLVMRNLALPGFADTQSLWTAVELFISNFSFFPAEDNDLMEMVVASVDEELASPPWRAAVVAGFSTASGRASPVISKAIWRWAERSQDAFTAALNILPNDAAVEQRLAEEVPRKLHMTNPTALLPLLLEKRFLVTHGAVLAATLAPLDAIDQQLKEDKDPHHSAGLRSALRYASSSQAMECALVHRDSRLIELCAELAITNSEILSNIHGEDITEQKVWCAAIFKDSSLWNAPINASGARNNFFAQLVRGLPADTDLLGALAQTPLADLSAHPDRAQLWSLLTGPELDLYLEATATGWLEIAARGALMACPEAPLERAIISSPSLRLVLERSSVTVDARLAIVHALSTFPEEMFITWLKGLLRGTRALSYADSEKLGKLVAYRRWENAAKYLSEQLAGCRTDVMPGLRLCADLLGLFTRWKLGISKPSVAEKWDAFEKEAQDLYPSGPDASELWSRAGGKNADLPGLLQTGATRWHTAINSIRYGGRPNARELLAVMCRDFPLNEQLRLYASDPDILVRR